MNGMILQIARVEQVEDASIAQGADGARVRARIHAFDTQDTLNLPWAFPLLPKTFHVTPKVNEFVLILTSEFKNPSSQRYYIGPIISQPQFFEKDDTNQALSLLSTSKANPLPRISLADGITRGSFPDKTDVALIGRGQEDIKLKYDKGTDTSLVELRAGIRQTPTGIDESRGLKGNVVFNDTDPAYIQLIHRPNALNYKGDYSNSAVNIVGGHINLMSNLDEKISDNITKQPELLDYTKFDDTVSKLSPAVKGDKLVELLELMRGSILNHVHPWAGMTACQKDWVGLTDRLVEYKIDEVLSNYVHLS